jgi:hypothetical protein
MAGEPRCSGEFTSPFSAIGKIGTMTVEQLVHEKRDQIRRLAAKHGATNIRVFGSVARGEARIDSDIDFLVDTGPVTSSWFPAGLVLDLEEVLGVPSVAA